MEQWKQHPKYTAYDVSSLGRVRRATGGVQGATAGRILKVWLAPTGYMKATVCMDGHPSQQKLHVLMLEAFVGKRPNGCEGRHLNDVKTDNRLENLAWGTRSQNYGDRVANGGGNHGSRHGMSRLTEDNVREIRFHHQAGLSNKQIAAFFGVSAGHVCTIIKRKAWRHM